MQVIELPLQRTGLKSTAWQKYISFTRGVPTHGSWASIRPAESLSLACKVYLSRNCFYQKTSNTF